MGTIFVKKDYYRFPMALSFVFHLTPWSSCSVSSSSSLQPKFHLRHDTTSTTYRASRDDVSCMLHRACSNMADDEEAAVLACKTISCFIINFIHQLALESCECCLNDLLDGNLCKNRLYLISICSLFWFSNMILSDALILPTLQLQTASDDARN